MTVMAFAEQLASCIAEHADDLRIEETNTKVTWTAAVGKQTFIVIVEELAKDDQEPATA
jgi:hypothetical protein